MEFVEFQIERSRRGEIAESTTSNYYKAAKLFCDMNDVSTVNSPYYQNKTTICEARLYFAKVLFEPLLLEI
jgi:hypothetical protein